MSGSTTVTETAESGAGVPRTSLQTKARLLALKAGPRYVRTPEGVAHYGLPIGSLIVPGGKPEQPTLTSDLHPLDLAPVHDRERVAGGLPELKEAVKAARGLRNMWDEYTEEINNGDPSNRSLRQYERLRAMGRHLSRVTGVDPGDNSWLSLGQTIAGEGAWIYWNPCREMRAAAWEMLGYENNGDTRPADPSIDRRTPGGDGYNDHGALNVQAAVMLMELHEAAADAPTLYRGVQVDWPERFVADLKEGDTFDLPLASFTDNRNHTDRFGTDVTFVLQKGAKTILGGSMGPDPTLDEDHPDYWDWENEMGTNAEYVSGGRFVITGVRKNGKGYTVLIRQQATFDPTSGLVERKSLLNGKQVTSFDWMFDSPLVTPQIEDIKEDRYVRTPEGARHYGQPIGSLIVPGPTVRLEGVPGTIDKDDPNIHEPYDDRNEWCYQHAAQYAVANSDPARDEHLFLVHGEVQISPNVPAINHAWVEFPNGDVFEPNTGHRMTHQEFEDFFNPKREAEYDAVAMRQQIMKNQHWGPWHERNSPATRIAQQLGRLLYNLRGKAALLKCEGCGKMYAADSEEEMHDHWSTHDEAKDVYGGAPGLETSRNYQHGHPVPRGKRRKIKARAAALVPNTTQNYVLHDTYAAKTLEAKARTPKDGDGDGFIFDGTPRMRPAPIGTPVVGDLTYAGKSPYGDTFQSVADAAGDKYHVGPDEEGAYVAVDDNENYVVEDAKTRVHALELLDKKTRGKTPAKKPAAKKTPATRARANAATSRAASTRKQNATTGKRKVNVQKAAKQVSVASILKEKGGDRTLADKAGGQEIAAGLNTEPTKASLPTVKFKSKVREKRDDPADYHMKNGKPVQTDALRRAAHLKSGGTQRALDLADERGRAFKLAPARDNEHLWFPKDPNSPVAYSFRQQKPLLDKDGAQVYKMVNGVKTPQFAPGEFGPRQPVYSKSYSDANKNAHFQKVAALIPVMHKLDRALKKDATKDPVAASVLMMRVLGIRPNTMSEESQAKNLKNKSPLKARALRARGIDPDQPIFGATSLRAEHVKFEGDEVHIEFMGKEHVWNTHVTNDPDIVAALKAHTKGKKPGQPIFNGVDADKTQDYIQSHLGKGVTNKDLRAFAATQIAAELMAGMPAPKDRNELEKMKARIAARVCLTLNNDAKQTLGSYIAAPIWSTWEKGIKE